QADAVPELPQPLERLLADRRREVVEDALGHQEIGRRRSQLRLELRELHGRLERQVDVVAEQQVARLRIAVEEGEPVAAGARCRQKLAVVLQLEGAAHASTSTSTSAAAACARSSASRFVSPSAIT